jgi:hypothetical protein
MGVWDKLRNLGSHVRKRWRSTDPDSYDQYKRGRERERKQAEQRRGHEERRGEQEREEVKRGREYEERYLAERAAKEPRTEAPRGDPSQPNDGSSSV